MHFKDNIYIYAPLPESLEIPVGRRSQRPKLLKERMKLINNWIMPGFKVPF